MLREAVRELTLQAGHHDADLSASFHEPGILAQVEIVGPKIVVRIETDQGIKEPVGEGSPTSRRHGRAGQRHHRRHHEHQGAGG